ncbi:ATP-binding cassette domain-containing protein [Sulfolobus acidocaldarius]|uniref:ABC transporter n=4 Tax=Sulfolobus acidocaldarius TaxID=2285 RepID=Q4JAR4_SULAC|nr:ABC transporter ATP-binding protein [Sulfolobus acidocaldarius]AAY80115.1 ABC transporter [Sulfolobus acidocaldarius DSM 639]AGE70690.1 ABC transporter [Sulfolobus acidocaldarius N8]AGE72962.1 ABC transporter [Sulfolobus acidocaldarius Ron12/I]ALU28970.1 ABC transporter [Sulfolobus acidocaldarius]ALU31697.1 ABC transporter [Sulfolobus acidocaldarius]
MIEAIGLSKSYLSPVLKGVTFKAESGRVTCIVGRNGSGKSTLIRILSTSEKPDSGTALIDGTPLEDVKRVREVISVLYDKNYLDAFLRVRDSIEFFISAMEIDRDKVYSLIKNFNLSLYLEKLVFTLSKGTQRKLALTFALSLDRPVSLLDEPTEGLDYESKLLFVREISAHAHDKTILMTTHDAQVVESACEKVMLLQNGQVKPIDVKFIKRVADKYLVVNDGIKSRLVLRDEVNGKIDGFVEIRKPTLLDLIFLRGDEGGE